MDIMPTVTSQETGARHQPEVRAEIEQLASESLETVKEHG